MKIFKSSAWNMYYGTCTEKKRKKDNHAQVYRYFVLDLWYCLLPLVALKVLCLPMLFVFIVLFFKSDNKMLSKVFLYIYILIYKTLQNVELLKDYWTELMHVLWNCLCLFNLCHFNTFICHELYIPWNSLYDMLLNGESF